MTEYATCPDLEVLAEWLDGQLDEPTRQRLAVHVGACDHCSEVVATVLAFDDEQALGESGEGTNSEDLEPDGPPTFVRDALHSEPRRFRWQPSAGLAFVACVAVVCVRLANPGTEFDATKAEKLRAELAAESRGSAVIPSCSEFLRDAEATRRYADLLPKCLEQARRESDLATLTVRLPDFSRWLADPGLREPSCRVLLEGQPRVGAELKTEKSRCRQDFPAPPP